MRKFLLFLLALIICTGCITANAVDYSDTVLPSFARGDVNKDGYVDNLDAAYILRHDAGIEMLSEDDCSRGDVNYDGETTNLDATLILKYDCGMMNAFCPEHNISHDIERGDVCVQCNLCFGHNYSCGICVDCGNYALQETTYEKIVKYIQHNGVEQESGEIACATGQKHLFMLYNPTDPLIIIGVSLSDVYYQYDTDNLIFYLHYAPGRDGYEVGYWNVTRDTHLFHGYIYPMQDYELSLLSPKHIGDVRRQQIADAAIILYRELDAFLKTTEMGTAEDLGFPDARPLCITHKFNPESNTHKCVICGELIQ